MKKITSLRDKEIQKKTNSIKNTNSDGGKISTTTTTTTTMTKTSSTSNPSKSTTQPMQMDLAKLSQAIAKVMKANSIPERQPTQDQIQSPKTITYKLKSPKITNPKKIKKITSTTKIR